VVVISKLLLPMDTPLVVWRQYMLVQVVAVPVAMH
jgi:hypothetical protein